MEIALPISEISMTIPNAPVSFWPTVMFFMVFSPIVVVCIGNVGNCFGY
ncbi:hypothetical protein [Burkholderia glumae]|nr:hypothetical protein [Burkholderia glumae]